MELGKHIGKGIWGFADKSLPVIYGIGFIFLVIRVLPPAEYGTFVIIQSITIIIFSLGFSFALQPLIKYASETDDYKSYFFAAFIYYTGFLFIGLIIIFIFGEIILQLFNISLNQSIRNTMWYVPIYIISAIPRNMILALLQAKFEIKKIFWIDFFYFIGSLIFIFIVVETYSLHSAIELLIIITITNFISSISALFIMTSKFNYFKPKVDKIALNEIWKLGKYSLGSSVNYSIHSQLDTFFVAYFTGVNGTAIYGAAKIITRIYDIYAQVIQMFILPASSLLDSKKESSKLTELLEKSTCFSLVSIIPIVFLLFFSSDLLINLLYNTKYPEAKNLLKLLSLMGIFIPWISVSSSVIFGIGKTNLIFKLTFINLILDFLFFYILGIIASIEGIIYAILLIQFIMSLLWFYHTKNFVNFSLLSIISRIKDIKNFLFKKTGIL